MQHRRSRFAKSCSYRQSSFYILDICVLNYSTQRHTRGHACEHSNVAALLIIYYIGICFRVDASIYVVIFAEMSEYG